MYKTKILIISKRKELSIKYKKLIESLNQDVICTNDLSESLSVIQKDKIEFIIVSDTIKEKLSDFIKKIRILTYNFRPIIIAISKSSDLEDRLMTLDAGADDFLGEEISKQEFQMRFKAHLRRYLESSVNSTTHILNKNITIKQLQRSLETKETFDNNLTYVLIKVKNIENYRLTHGEIAYEKVIQTLGAITNSTLSNNDFLGHISDNELVLITNLYNAEKLCAFLVFAFDNILNKFYSKDEYKDNFTIQSDDSIQEIKSPLMRLNITAVQKKENEKDFRNIINNLNELMELCEKSDKSTYIIDRIKLNGETITRQEKNRVLILEFDESLSYLLKNVCELNGINVKIANSYLEFDEIYDNFKPDVVILDWGKDKNTNSLEFAKKIKNDSIKLIFSSSYLNKKEILKAGADLYLPKPYEIDDMINWIKKFLEN